MQQNVDLRLLPVEAVLLVADGADRLAGNALHLRLHGLLVERGADLTGDHDAVGGRKRFAGHTHLGGIHASLGRFLEEQIDHLVRDAVTDLVRMPFGHRFRREKIRRPRHERLLSLKGGKDGHKKSAHPGRWARL